MDEQEVQEAALGLEQRLVAVEMEPVQTLTSLNLAEASLAETEYLLMLGRDLGHLAGDVTEPLLVEVSEISRMLYARRGKVEQGGSAEWTVDCGLLTVDARLRLGRRAGAVAGSLRPGAQRAVTAP